jgi:hypothetical protein
MIMTSESNSTSIKKTKSLERPQKEDYKKIHNEPLRCLICQQVIENSDLVTLIGDSGEEITVHFNCYLNLQEKICSECGKPFKDQEKLYYCPKHKTYFHMSHDCVDHHIQKHLSFYIGKYDAKTNRIILEETEER